jgi:outer membrane protein TolC
LQNQLGGAYGNLISGGLQSFTDPSALLAQYQQQFNNTVAPGLAAQYGAGSPQIASQQNQGLVNLLGNQYNQGISNYLNTLGGAAGYGTTAIGATGQTSGTGTSTANTSGQNSATTSYGPTLLSLLANLGSGINSGITSLFGGS